MLIASEYWHLWPGLAIDRGYDVTLVEDAHTISDAQELGVISVQAMLDEQNMASHQYDVPRRRCTLVTASEAFA